MIRETLNRLEIGWLEALEGRRLFALFGLDGGVLDIPGTAASDAISVWLDESDNQLIVDVNGFQERVDADAVSRIVVRSFAGRDFVEIDQDLTIGARVQPGSGADTCLGGGGNDYLYGASGNDVLDGRGGNDTLHGQAGADDLAGGDGRDRATYKTHHLAVWADLDDLADDGSPGEHDNLRSDIEDIRGGTGDDRLVGNELDNRLLGNAGDDTLTGGLGDDTLVGQRGRDLILAIDHQIDHLNRISFKDKTEVDDDDVVDPLGSL